MAALLFVPLTSAIRIEPFSGNRLISFDGDLTYDYFTPRYGVVKRINAAGVRSLDAPKSDSHE